MGNTIQEYAVKRGIQYLMHFTRASNLGSILQRGLVLRNTLIQEGYRDFNDQYRIDGTNAICLSIGFPNYKMFWGLRKNNPGVDWVILVIRPEVMWTLSCAFCATNAATTSVTAIPLAQRSTLAALQAMYSDWNDKTRTLLNIPDNYPTNPQAEVLMLEGVPRHHILGVFVLNETMKKSLQAQFPKLNVRVNAGYFRYRRDYEQWR